MTLTPEVFAAGWVILLDRFKREFTQFSEEKYFEILSEELNDAQFQFAINRSFRHDEFFPSPQKLINHAKGELEDTAALLWQRITRNRTTVGFDPLAEKAFKDAGGFARLDYAQDQFEIREMRRDFEASFREQQRLKEFEMHRHQALPSASGE